ncbi:MAG: RNA polymerase sigma-70 factor [Bacteroidales bacterium]|jgi:RNA polymerase sigma-70 factor (ECF subfamily)|nr:RNA polymerase sigma-70 factor [Bacteroidales bacterium]
MEKENAHIELLSLLSQDDESALKKLYHLYYDRLFRFAMHLVKDEMSCEEIISDLFFNIWQNRKKPAFIRDLDAYLFASVRNGCLKHIDRESRRPKGEALSASVEYIPDGSDPENMAITGELNRVLSRAVESLPERCRVIFKLAREDGLKYREIADILGISVRTIDAQMTIARQKIEAVLQKYFR